MIAAREEMVVVSGSPMLMLQVDNDPRVIAARTALALFRTSPVGQLLTVSHRGAAPEDLERYEAHVRNLSVTRRAVINEVAHRAQAAHD